MYFLHDVFHNLHRNLFLLHLFNLVHPIKSASRVGDRSHLLRRHCFRLGLDAHRVFLFFGQIGNRLVRYFTQLWQRLGLLQRLGLMQRLGLFYSFYRRKECLKHSLKFLWLCWLCLASHWLCVARRSLKVHGRLRKNTSKCTQTKTTCPRSLDGHNSLDRPWRLDRPWSLDGHKSLDRPWGLDGHKSLYRPWSLDRPCRWPWRGPCRWPCRCLWRWPWRCLWRMIHRIGQDFRVALDHFNLFLVAHCLCSTEHASISSGPLFKKPSTI